MRTYYFLGATQSARLRNGHYVSKWENGSSEADFESFYLLPGEQEESAFALAIYSWEWIGGSSSQSWAAQVFTCANGKLKVVQQITNDSHHFDQTAASYDPSTRVLTIKSNRYGNGANCCPEKLDVMELRWDGSEFKRVSLKTIPHPK